ncbi:MAG: RecX family transcriptional regulator [Muribaculaceae bacterium]|nr:RecX family transcriptional regulator [Muribaculaceae bacterium]
MKPRKVPTEAEATARLEALCAKSEQCTYDIRDKLKRWGVPTATAEAVIRHLTQASYVNDSRFASAYVRDKYRFSCWGRRKISAGLYAKRIDRDIATRALDEIDVKEYATIAFRTVKAKLRSLDRTDMRLCREKLLRFGMARGYETKLLLKILDSRSLWSEQ